MTSDVDGWKSPRQRKRWNGMGWDEEKDRNADRMYVCVHGDPLVFVLCACDERERERRPPHYICRGPPGPACFECFPPVNRFQSTHRSCTRARLVFPCLCPGVLLARTRVKRIPPAAKLRSGLAGGGRLS